MRRTNFEPSSIISVEEPSTASHTCDGMGVQGGSGPLASYFGTVLPSARIYPLHGRFPSVRRPATSIEPPSVWFLTHRTVAHRSSSIFAISHLFRRGRGETTRPTARRFSFDLWIGIAALPTRHVVFLFRVFVRWHISLWWEGWRSLRVSVSGVEISGIDIDATHPRGHHGFGRCRVNHKDENASDSGRWSCWWRMSTCET